MPSLLALPNIRLLHLPATPPAIRGLPFLLLAPLKVAHQIWALLDALLFRIPQPPEFIMVQVRGDV